MKILMLTNTYLPHVGGVANSVSSFAQALRARGHGTVVVAPRFDGVDADEEAVVRVPAIQHFNGSDFSYRLPAPRRLYKAIEQFQPDVIHSHHPFLLGDTAVRIAASRNLPLVFTHHTMYERYTHYVPGDSPAMKQFAMRLATQYANLCDHVIAPSQSIEAVLRSRGVVVPISAIPTGIDPARFARGDGQAARTRWGVPTDALVVGHVGRLAPEKNLPFLADATARFLADRPNAHALVVGGGPSRDDIQRAFEALQVEDRLHMPGPLRGQELVDAYHAMDVFAFASETETQGMVIAEAMAARTAVVAIDAPGVREAVRDGENGRLLPTAQAAAFADALAWFADLSPTQRGKLDDAARRTAESLSIARCTEHLIEVYQGVCGTVAADRDPDASAWAQTQRMLEAEWALWSTRAEAAVNAAVGATVDAIEQMTRPIGGKG